LDKDHSDKDTDEHVSDARPTSEARKRDRAGASDCTQCLGVRADDWDLRSSECGVADMHAG